MKHYVEVYKFAGRWYVADPTARRRTNGPTRPSKIWPFRRPS